MIIHKDSHTDHAITPDQWAYILAQFTHRSSFFIETIELPEGLGPVMNGLYGPSCGDAPIPDSAVYYAQRPPRTWNSRMTRLPARPTRFVRIIAGPRGGHDCVLFTAYGVFSKDMPQAPREPRELLTRYDALPFGDARRGELHKEICAAEDFWDEHALATEVLDANPCR